MSKMMNASTQTMLTSLTPPILPRSVGRTPVKKRPTSFPTWQPPNPPEPATNQTSQWTTESAASHSLIILPCRPRASSEATANPSDGEEEDSPLFNKGKQAYPPSASSSTSTLLPSERRIVIEPSTELCTMQSTQFTLDFSPGRHKLSRYVNDSQGSPTLEVYIPTGTKPDVYIPTGAPARPVFEAKSLLTPEEPASYGPSREDIESLLERQRVFKDSRIAIERKNSSALVRLSTFTSELRGSVKRTLTMGFGKKSFEPRVKAGEGEKRPVKRSLIRSKTLFGGGGDVGRKKSVFTWKAGTGIPWKGRRAYTLGGTRGMGGMERVVELGRERENENENEGEGGQRGDGERVRFSWEEEVVEE